MKGSLASNSAVPARPTRRRRWRSSHRLLAVTIVITIIAVIGGATDLAYVSLKSRAGQLQATLTADLQAGQTELEAGKASLKEANAKHDPKLAAEASAHFVTAGTRFAAAGQLADNSRLLRDLEQVPIVRDLVRSRHVAVSGIAGMGIAISSAGQSLAEFDATLIAPQPKGQAARNLLTVLGQATPVLSKVRQDIEHAQQAAASVDAGVLPAAQQAPFIKARATLATALDGLVEFERLTPILKEMLGGNGARTYLIEQVNPAELRAGGGFIGTYSLVRADHGTISLTSSGDAYPLTNPRASPGQRGFIPQPSPLREIIPTIPWTFVDSNIYPDFPSNAKAALSFVQPRFKTKIDGVISMDYYTVAKMLELTGPMAVPGFGLTVTATNFVPQLIRLEIAGDPYHKSMLSALAGPLMQRVSSLGPGRWPALVGAFNSLAAGRHLQAYFLNSSVEQEVTRIGWSGSVNPTGARDYMMEVEANYSGNKANYVLRRNFSIVLTRSGNILHHTVAITLTNATTKDSYVRTYYHVNIRFLVGAKASSISGNLTPVRYGNPAAPAGTTMLDGWLMVPCCFAQREAVFTYDTTWQVDAKGFYGVYLQKQPGTINDSVDVTWNNGSGHTFRVTGNLSQDRNIVLSATGVSLAAGHPAEATLPSLNFG